MSSSKISRGYFSLASWLVSIVAVLVMIGWYTRSATLVQILPRFTPMQFNTALEFLILSESLRAFLRGQRRWLYILIGVSMLVSGLTFFEYILHTSFGIDDLFVEPFISAGTYYSGRMGLNTAVGFLFLSLSLFLVLQNTIVCLFIAVSFSVFVGCISLVSLSSYFFDINSNFAWGSASNMAIHTSICMALLAFSLGFAVYLRIQRRVSGVLVSFGIMVAVTSLTVLITQLLVQGEVRKTKDFLSLKVESVTDDVISHLMSQHQAFMQMASRWEHGLYKSQEDWRADAANYYSDIGGIQSILWVNSNYIIKWLYPEKGNELLIERDVRLRPRSLQNIQTAQQMGRPFVTHSTELIVGGKGFAMLYPLTNAKKKYDGTLSIAYKFQNMFPRFLNTPGYYIQIYEDDELIYSSGHNDPILHDKWKTSHDAELLNKKWKVVLSPTLEVLQKQTNYVPSLVLGFGLLISTMLSLASLLYFRALEAEKKTWLISEWQKAVMESSHVLIISTDERGLVKTFNRAAEDLLEYKAEEVVDKVMATFWHDSAEVPQLEAYIAATRQGQIETREWTMISKSGKKYQCNMTIRPMYSDSGDIFGFVGSLENVTDKKAQQAVMLTTARLVSLGEMAAGIAHEVNNPLTIISGQAFSLKKTLEARDDENEKPLIFKLERIEATVQRIAKIIRGLRSFAREADPEDKQMVSINAMVEETLSFCSERFRNAGVELEVELAEDMAFFGYGFQISQILLNLLNNAFDAVQNAAVKRVHLKTAAVGEMIEISVEDSGHGVPAELREKIMRPFFTTKQVGEGLGLGLSISQGIATAHQGVLFLNPDSVVTVFTLRLPRVAAIAAIKGSS